MDTFKKILVPFDEDTRSIRALEYAAMFATKIGAKITALHLADPRKYHSQMEINKDLANLIENQLQPRLFQIHKKYADIRKIDLQILGMQHTVATHIIDFALEKQFDFIVMRSHGLTQGDDWERHFKSTNAYRVLLDAPCPVFTFTQIPDQPKIEHMVVPVDLSEGCLYKIPIAISLANRFKAKVHLVVACKYEEDDKEVDERASQVDMEMKQHGIEVVQTPVHHGRIADAVLSYCNSHDIDLVIIMSRPGFRWSDLWISPKAKSIVSWSKVPVLSLRTDKPLEITL